LGIQTYVGSKSLARFCCDFLNLQRLAESAFSKFDRQLRHKQDNCFTQRSEIAGSVIGRVGRHEPPPMSLRPRVPKPGSAKPETPTSPVFHLFFTGQSARGFKLVTEDGRRIKVPDELPLLGEWSSPSRYAAISVVGA